MLSQESYEFYLQNGYVKLDQDFLNESDFSEFRKLAYEVLFTKSAEGRSKCIPQIQDLEPRLLKWLLHPTFVNLAKDMLGPDVAFCTATIYFKQANSDKILTWHRDYHIVPNAPVKVRKSVINIVLSLDPAPIESGCLQYVPGSHLEEIKFLKEAVPNTMIQTAVVNTDQLQQKPVYAPLRANQATAHNALIVHGSGPNKSQNDRCFVSVRFYSASDGDALSYYLLNCTGSQLVSGQDLSGKKLPKSEFYCE